MHRPVRPSLLAKLASAVERVDDPDTPGAEPSLVVDAFLREHRVIGTLLREQLHQQLV